MFHSVLTKSLYTLRWQLLGWILAIAGIALLTMTLYPSFSQNGIENIVKSVPDSLKSLVGNVADFKTVPGYIGQQIFGPNLYIVSLIMSILLFMGISASEESDGRLQTVLSFPVSRTRVYVEKYLATTIVLAIVSASVALAIWIALLSINKSADYGRIWQSVLGFGLINLAYGTLAYAVAFFTGNKGFTVLLVAGYAVASLFITTLSPAVDKLKTIDHFSLLHYYNNPQIMTNGLNAGNTLVIVGVIVVLLVIGWLGFLRRDVRTN